jgi:hypothetical protein
VRYQAAPHSESLNCTAFFSEWWKNDFIHSVEETADSFCSLKSATGPKHLRRGFFSPFFGRCLKTASRIQALNRLDKRLACTALVRMTFEPFGENSHGNF